MLLQPCGRTSVDFTGSTDRSGKTGQSGKRDRHVFQVCVPWPHSIDEKRACPNGFRLSQLISFHGPVFSHASVRGLIRPPPIGRQRTRTSVMPDADLTSFRLLPLTLVAAQTGCRARDILSFHAKVIWLRCLYIYLSQYIATGRDSFWGGSRRAAGGEPVAEGYNVNRPLLANVPFARRFRRSGKPGGNGTSKK